jgi:hypothetical protein
MSRTPQHDVHHALAYPEPPVSSLWHRNGPAARPLTPAQQRRNRELLDIAQYTPRPRSLQPPGGGRQVDTLARSS